ncbi:MAG: hypothetical protein GY810_30360 [Aureispira sp.]|nr:hypothetical protein [Aureispira sp.]
MKNKQLIKRIVFLGVLIALGYGYYSLVLLYKHSPTFWFASALGVYLFVVILIGWFRNVYYDSNETMLEERFPDLDGESAMKGLSGWRHLHFMSLKKPEVHCLKKSENDIFTEYWHTKRYDNEH